MAAVRDVEHKNPERVAAGLKAVLHNPNTTAQARQNAHDRLVAMGVATEPLGDKDAGTKADAKAHEHHVLGGYKATLKSAYTLTEWRARVDHTLISDPNVSEAAKLHAEEMLHEHGE